VKFETSYYSELTRLQGPCYLTAGFTAPERWALVPYDEQLRAKHASQSRRQLHFWDAFDIAEATFLDGVESIVTTEAGGTCAKQQRNRIMILHVCNQISIRPAILRSTSSGAFSAILQLMNTGGALPDKLLYKHPRRRMRQSTKIHATKIVQRSRHNVG